MLAERTLNRLTLNFVEGTHGMNKMVRIACVLVCQSLLADAAVDARDVDILLSCVSSEPVRLNEPVDDSGDVTWLLPDGMDELIVPFSGGVIVDRSRPEMMQWLRGGSPWELRPLFCGHPRT